MQPLKRSADGSRKQRVERRPHDPRADQSVADTASWLFLERGATFFDEAEQVKIKDLISSVTRWVGGLPASETNHHSGCFGLLRHSFMVAVRFIVHLGSVREMLARLDGTTRKSWILAGTAAAFLHDCGKLLDQEVWLSTSGKTWNPLEQSLGDFVDGNISDEDEVLSAFLPGRGLKGHEGKGRALIPLILPLSFVGDLTTQTLAIYDACISHHELKDPMTHWPAAWFAAILIIGTKDEARNSGRAQFRRTSNHLGKCLGAAHRPSTRQGNPKPKACRKSAFAIEDCYRG